jgi:hypothetical protein
MGRVLAGLGGAFGLAALWRFLRRPAAQPPPVEADQSVEADPASELRSRLEQARQAADDRDEFDAAEGQPVDEVEQPRSTQDQAVDEVEQPRSIEDRRQAIHEKAQQALGEMNRSEPSD